MRVGVARYEFVGDTADIGGHLRSRRIGGDGESGRRRLGHPDAVADRGLEYVVSVGLAEPRHDVPGVIRPADATKDDAGQDKAGVELPPDPGHFLEDRIDPRRVQPVRLER